MVFPGRKGWEVNFSLPRNLGTRFFSLHFLQVQVSSPLITNFKAEIYRGEGEPSLVTDQARMNIKVQLQCGKDKRVLIETPGPQLSAKTVLGQILDRLLRVFFFPPTGLVPRPCPSQS